MADAITTITIYHQRGTAPEAVEPDLIRNASAAVEGVSAVAARLAAIAGGIEGGTVLVRVDDATAVAAAGTIACAQADATAGDRLQFFVPGYASPFTLTGVAGAAGLGQYSVDTSDTAVGASVAAAINALPGLRDIVSASAATGTVTVTAKRAGLAGNGISIVKVVTTAGAFTVTQPSGGLETSTRPSATVTFGTPDIAADNTIRIGSRTYTWKASASADGEITLSTTPAVAATNFAAAINADATWTGLLAATRADAVVTLTWLAGSREGKQVNLVRTETNSGSVVLSGAALAAGTTVTSSSATARYVLGGGQ